MMADPNLVFTAEHLKALKEFLWPAQTQYKNIYIALGFNVSDLQASANQVRDLYTEVITAVVNKGTTKQELVAALRSRPVGYGQLAQKLHDDTNIEDGEFITSTQYSGSRFSEHVGTEGCSDN